MRELPGGTVTLLFTDIEGSTSLLAQVGEGYSSVLTEYRHLLRAVCRQWNGHEVDTQGDAFFAAFARATDAVSAAVQMQRAIAAHTWPNGMAVRVRMGLHTGEPQLSTEDYVGIDVHQTARIMSAGHGGQVLLSQTTRDLMEHDVPDGVSLRDLGAHRLKDLEHPHHLYQLVIAGLLADFPHLKTLNTHPNNLPVQLTSLIGREQEVATVQKLLLREDIRLLTLTGPGGIGKTRLGLQVAAELSDRFADGVFFVNLAPISDAALVIPTIADTLDIKETGGQSLLDQLKVSLRDKHLLLLLDNFEQVLSAAPQVNELLAACPNLKVIVTIRAVLHVRGEQEFSIPPLAVPDSSHVTDLVALSQYEAVALFISRAQAVKPNFQLTNASVPAVAEICAHLDGLPLAIELAAARIKLLPPQALLARLGQRLALLTSGAKDAPMRQQTLRNTIEWSYNLLDANEQRLFRQLAIFVGGCSLQAVEVICTALDGGAAHVLEAVASLLDKSLLQQSEHEEGEVRFTMLETVLEYGLECLRESEELQELQRQHALYYLTLAEKAEPHLKGTQQVQWRRRLEREHDNLRTAMVWLIEHEETDLSLRMVGALWWFWFIRGLYSEGRRWLEAALGLPQVNQRTTTRAKALCGAGWLSSFMADSISARSLLEESVILFRELGDKRGLAEAQDELAEGVYRQQDTALARSLLEENVLLAREIDDRWLLAMSLHHLGRFIHDQDEVERADLLLNESKVLYGELGDTQGLSHVLNTLTRLAWERNDVTPAEVLSQESLILARALDSKLDIAEAIYRVARTKLLLGDATQAMILLEECIALTRGIGDKGHLNFITAQALLILGSIARYQANLVHAATVLEESLTLLQELNHKDVAARALSELGEVRRLQGNLVQAMTLAKEGLLLAREAMRHNEIGRNLIVLARIAADEGQLEYAARLFGAAEPWLNSSMEMDPLERSDYEAAVEGVRARMSEKAFDTAWAEGLSMTPEQTLTAQEAALASALEPAGLSSPPPTKPAPTYPAGLTSREVEILRLVAQGLTDTQEAQKLIISPRTVNWHLTTIYSKLGVSSRSAATRYAIEHHLL